jgi:hypothetical protein
MALAKLQQKTVEALRGLRDTPPVPGHAQTHEPHEPGRRHPVRLAVVKTPIVPDDSVGGSANSTAGQVAIAGHNGIHPVEDSDAQQTITGVSGAQIVISGDHTSVVVPGTRLIIDGSTGNDGWHEVDVAPTYATIPDETTITFRVALPDATVDGVVVLPTGWIPAETTNVRQASAHTGVVAFPGDYIAVGQIDEELIAIAGPTKVFGYLTETLESATIDENSLSAGNASFRIMYFDSSNEWVDSGLTRTVENLFEGVAVSYGTLITAEFVYNRWVLTAVGCQATALTFP